MYINIGINLHIIYFEYFVVPFFSYIAINVYFSLKVKPEVGLNCENYDVAAIEYCVPGKCASLFYFKVLSRRHLTEICWLRECGIKEMQGGTNLRVDV